METQDNLVASTLTEFESDLWFERRLKVDVIIQHLERIYNSNEKLKHSAIGWIQFFKFLVDECSGQNFTNDKQWGELLNLMQINRKLNHRSVRIIDLMRNRLIIESNAKCLREFNIKAKLIKSINNSLDQLKHDVQKNLLLCLPVAALNQPVPIFLSEIRSASKFIKDQSRPLIRTLTADISEGLLISNVELTIWKSKLQESEKVISAIDGFLNNLSDLQSKFLDIGPLLGNTEEKAKVSSGQLHNNLEECKKQFKEVQVFHRDLVNSLFQQVSRRRGDDPGSFKNLPLIRLLSPTTLQLHSIYDNDLIEALKKINSCRSNMDKIMQTLRIEFGWFYFVNDRELLQIIALDSKLATKSEKKDNQHLIRKLFNNSINSFILNDKNQLIGVKNPYGECIILREEPIQIHKQVNIYSLEIVRILNETMRKLRRSLKSMLFAILGGQEPNFDPPIQVMNLRDYVEFTNLVETKLIAGESLDSLINIYKQKFAQLNDKVDSRIVKDQLKHSSQTSLIIHFLSRLINLQAKQVSSLSDWHWQKEIRYYRIGEELEVRIADAKFTYKFDYLPILADDFIETNQVNSRTFKRLINTLITERCYLVASQAVCNFKLGANPYGPAGCGKTETIKTLGHLFGCQVVVHNCDESNNIESLDRLIWGLAHTGLWGCFDEFNRLSSSVLSGVSATLELVQSSIREGRITVETPSGDMMCIESHSAFFITLNPSQGDRYKGRRRLPTNLRSLFIPICMERVAVDTITSEHLLALGAKVKLNGEESLKIGRQLQTWLENMKQETVDCRLIEWDLRLVMAILKRFKIMLTSFTLAGDPIEVLVEAICCEVVARLEENQLSLFENSIKSFFNRSANILSADKLFSNQNKMMQLDSQLESRTGVLIFGPVGSGKSLCWRNLASSKEDSVKWLAMNPKAVDKSKLFGHLDITEQKWFDGLLTKLVREAHDILQSTKTIKQVWLILDGPLDPDWVESLNSVMDDNQILTLCSGERLSFCTQSNQKIKLIFETDEIEFVSPATISRLGVVVCHNTCTAAQQTILPTPINLDAFSFMSSEEKRLMTVNHQNEETLDEFINKTFTKERDVSLITYNCSELTNSSHLLKLMKFGGAKSVYLLKNAHLIGAQDEWQSKTLFEFLRFIASYGGYYNEELSFQQTNSKFILTTNSLDSLSARLRSASFLVDLPEDSKGKKKEEEGKDTVIQIKDLCLNLTTECLIKKSILMIRNSVDINQLVEQLSSKSELKVFDFCTTNSVDQSLIALSKSIDTSAKNQEGKFELFILNDMQESLMSKSHRAQLYHLLNLIPQQVRVIYLVNPMAKCDNINFKYWRSISQIVYLKDNNYDEISLKETIETELKDKLFIGSVDCKQLSWLTEKVVLFLKKQSELDRQKVMYYLDFLSKLINKSTKEQETQQRALSGGLKRLAEFESIVEARKLQMKEEEKRLFKRKEEIESLSKSIDETMKVGIEQRKQFNRLSEQQTAKAIEVVAKQQKVELELSKVLPLIEESKKEVSQHLQPEALNEIKSLRSPPKVIKDILDVLLMILGVNDNSWTSIKTYLTKYSLKEQLTSFDFNNKLSATLLAKIEREIQIRDEAFQPGKAARASKAVLPIVSWINATIEYGRVLVRLKPLRNQMEQLQVESKRLNEEALNTELQCKSLDKQLDLDSKRLEQLESEFKLSEQKLNELQSTLKDIMKMRLDLESQVNRWRNRLIGIESLLEPINLNLWKLCLATTSLVLFVKDLNEIYDKWFLQFELNSMMTINQFLSELLKYLSTDTDWLSEISFKKEDDTKRVLQLLLLRLSLQYDLKVPIILHFDKDLQQTEEELQQSLSFKQILVNSTSEVALLRYSSIAEWKVALSVVLRRQKLILLEMTSQEIQLDSLQLVLNKSSSTNNESRLLLIGNFNQLPSTVQRLILPVKLVQSANSPEEMKLSIKKRIVEAFSGDLSESVDKLEGELQREQSCAQRVEINLLTRLASAEVVVGNCDLGEDLALILSELQEQSRSLERYQVKLSEKLLELSVEEGKFEGLSEKAVSFYASYLSDLCQSDRFCRMSLDNYARLLVAALHCNQSRSQEGKVIERELPYLFICKQVLLSARSERRRHFIETLRLGSNQQQVNDDKQKEPSSTEASELPLLQLNNNDNDDVVRKISQDFTKQFQLKIIIGNLLQDDEDNTSSSSSSCLAQLMIVMFEATKSSPQLEIDEIFRSHKSSRFSYRKIYASVNNIANVESAILDTTTQSRCLCIVNAHLISNWINERLINLLNLFKVKALIILVAEDDNHQGNEEQQQQQQFNLDVLSRAQVKYWHDDLAHNALVRYELLHRLIPTTNSNADGQLLCKQLLLLHIICQERAKYWKRDYSFDTDQLRLAFATLQRLYLSTQSAGKGVEIGGQLRRSEVHKLIESSFYASRMEVEEDDTAMSRLFQLIFTSDKSKKVLEQLEVTVKEEDSNRKKLELLDNLIGSSTNSTNEWLLN